LLFQPIAITSDRSFHAWGDTDLGFNVNLLDPLYDCTIFKNAGSNWCYAIAIRPEK